MTYRKVGVKDINFKASPEFIKEVKRETDRDLERDMGGVKVIRKQLYSKEERIARALEVIEKNGVLTLGDCFMDDKKHTRPQVYEGDLLEAIMDVKRGNVKNFDTLEDMMNYLEA
ncbi:Uncharacterised protein [Segatella copri]|nr:Uncharacterised protein [Segatella copri]